MLFCVWSNQLFTALLISYNWATQKSLHLTQPAVYREFINGPFSVKRSRGNFNKLLPDQVIEHMINKEQKGSGGIIGISTLDGVFQRWMLSSQIIAGLRPTSKKVSIFYREKLFLEIWAKHWLKMRQKLCRTARVSSKVEKCFWANWNSFWSVFINRRITSSSKRFNEYSNNGRKLIQRLHLKSKLKQ